MRRAAKFLRATQNALVLAVEVFAAALLIVLVVVAFTGVVDRFLLQYGFPWPEELSRYLLIWLSLLSGALAVTKKGHYVLDYVYKSVLPSRGQVLSAGILGNAVTVAVALVFLVKSLELVERVSVQVAPALRVSMGWAYAALPAGFAFIAFFYFVELVWVAAHRELEDKPAGYTERL